MNPEILTKLKELQLLIEKEKNPEGQTMVDFFRPVATKMVRTIKWKVLNDLGYKLHHHTDSHHITDIIHSTFNTIDAEYLLEHSGGVHDETPWMDDVKNHIRKNETLQAVKIYKSHTSLSLKECKEYIDMLKEQFIQGKI